MTTALALARFAKAVAKAVDTSIYFGDGWMIAHLPTPSANARILISRNKREGGYCGCIIGYWRVLKHCKGSKHRRAGAPESRSATLRDWSRA